jgi:hypothetical protein
MANLRYLFMMENDSDQPDPSGKPGDGSSGGGGK